MIDTLQTPAATAAWRPAAVPRRALAALAGWIGRALAEAARRRRIAEARAALEAMDDSMLADIGMTRADIPFRVAGRDPDTMRR